MSWNVKRHLGFIPIPALILIVAVLHFVVKPSLFFEPTWLLPLTNTLFVTAICFIIAYIAIRNYRTSGRIQILLLGCGVFAFGIAAAVAAFVRSVPVTGANLNVTIYNMGALVAAIFHFVAALMLLAGISPEAGSKRKESWAVLSYVGLTVFTALLTMASMRGMIPPFFIQGVGATVLRQEVLGSADVLFAFSFLIFMGTYLRNSEAFLYWYASALALTSISLTGFFIESAIGSPIGWASRFSQYLGGIYFLIAVISAIRGSRARRISFDRVLTAALSPAEEKFRALSENSPDIIIRFDREMRHIYVNPAALRLYGKPAGSIIGKRIEETELPADYCGLWKERIERVLERGAPVQVEGYLPAGETARFYQSYCVPEYGADGSVANVLVVSRDLTERKWTEEALRRSEERYRSLFNGMTEGFALHEIICDERGEPSDYRFLEVNPAFERLTGLKRDNLLGKTVKHVMPGIEPHWIETYGKVALTGEPAHFDNFASALEKHYDVFAYSPAPRQFAAMFTDITVRKKAEQALRESEQRWATTLASIGDAVIATDVEGKIAFMNLVAEELTGWTLMDASMKPVTEVFNIINEQTRSEVESPVTKVLNEGTVVGLANHTILVKKDGTEVPIDDSGAPIRDADGKITGVVLVFRDISERKRIDEALRESKGRLDLALQSASMGAWHWDLIEDRRFFDDQVCCLLGIEPATFTGTADEFFGAVHPDDREMLKAALARTIQQDALYEPEYRAVWPDGSVHYIAARGRLVRNDTSNKPERIYGIIWDITERKRTEEILLKSHDELELRVQERTEALRRQADLLELAHSAIFVHDLESRITFWNHRAEEVYGWTRNEALGNVTHTFLKTRFPVPFDEHMAIVTKEGRWEGELEHTTKDGRNITVLSRHALQRDEAGNPAAILEINLDVTEARRTEQQLRQAQKMEALGTLTGGIAHDFNNILAAIIGFTELVADHVPKESREAHHLKRVMESSLRGRDLVRQMLTYSRKTEQEKKPLSLEQYRQGDRQAHSGDHADDDQYQGQHSE